MKQIGDTITWRGVNREHSGVVTDVHIQYVVKMDNGKYMVVTEEQRNAKE